MALTTDKVRADLGEEGQWEIILDQKVKEKEIHYIALCNGETVLHDIHPFTVKAGYEPKTFRLPNGMTVAIGYVSLTKLCAEFRRDNDLIHRTSKKSWRKAGRLDSFGARMERVSKGVPENQAMLERQKALRPSIIVDISFGILFFFVAREFGLVTAALTGAAATIGLFIIQPFVKWDLLGGFAVFGVVMSLISAGFAWYFQDDLAVKLRGTWMALIGAGFAFSDAFFLKGGYLGQRMAMYMEGLGRLNPRRASLALGGATLLLMAIDTPLAFILTTDQWIWYNSVFDMFIAIPIILGAMYLAREKDETPT